VNQYDFTNPNEILSTHTGKALCLYVRREVRTLTKEDWNSFLEASYTLHLYDEEEGQAKFGSTYHPITYLIRFHHFNAALQDQDHIHEGNGFLTPHLKMTNIFDEAVRSVNPGESIPYWDFTIDHQLGYLATECFVTQESTYGNVQPPKDIYSGYQYETDDIQEGRIISGLWKDTKAEKNIYYPSMESGYGYLRAPWNMNPSPYLSRFPFIFGSAVTLPSCTAHYSILQYTELMDFFYSFSIWTTCHSSYNHGRFLWL
jgi:hypothetical protein